MLKQKKDNISLSWPSASQCLFVDQQSKSVGQWLQDVATARQKLAGRNGQTALLEHKNFYTFSVLFIALLAERVNVVLPPNSQAETLKRVSLHCDFVFNLNLSKLKCAEAPLAKRISIPMQTEVIFFTSGSSGEPKLIRKQLMQLVSEVQVLENTFGRLLSEHALFCATVPVHHIYGLLFRLLWPLSAGYQLLTPTIEYSEHLNTLPEDVKACLISSPAHLSRFESFGSYQGVLNGVFSSGGPLAYAVAERIEMELGDAPIEVFGSTETGGIGWRRSTIENQPWNLFEGIEVKVDSSECLVLRSPYLPTQEWYYSADRVKLLSSNSFRLLGRADRIVKLAEKRVALPEMEMKCQQHAYIEDVRMVPVAAKRSCLGAVVVLSSEGQKALAASGKLLLTRQIRDFLASDFDRVVLPRKFRFVNVMPHDERGKVHQQLLEELFQ